MIYTNRYGVNITTIIDQITGKEGFHLTYYAGDDVEFEAIVFDMTKEQVDMLSGDDVIRMELLGDEEE